MYTIKVKGKDFYHPDTIQASHVKARGHFRKLVKDFSRQLSAEPGTINIELRYGPEGQPTILGQVVIAHDWFNEAHPVPIAGDDVTYAALGGLTRARVLDAMDHILLIIVPGANVPFLIRRTDINRVHPKSKL